MDWAVRRSHEPIVQLLKRFEKDGTLPARPSREQYEALAPVQARLRLGV
jgi:hypothetical protein